MQEIMNIRTYIKDISRYSRVSPEEENKLGKKIKDGDRKAFEDLITANLGLVLHIANKYKNKGISYEDLVSEGNLGLTIAASKWAHKRKIRFSTYAYFWIKRQMLFALNSKLALVRTPTNLSSAANSLNRKVLGIENEGSGKLTEAEIRHKFGNKYKNQSVESILTKLRTAYCDLMVNSANGNSYDRVDRSLRTDSFEHALENEDGKAKLKDRVRQILKNIRHGNVVTSMFGLNDNAPHSGRNIAKNRRVSVQTIHNWKLEAYKKVKSNYDEEEFYDYLPS